MLTPTTFEEVNTMKATRRIAIGAALAGSLLTGGAIGATIAGPLLASAASPSTASSAAATAASPSANSGKFVPNEDPARYERGADAVGPSLLSSGCVRARNEFERNRMGP